MNIAIDISPLKSGHFLQHRVRGTGFYVENLKNSLLKYFPSNNYVFFGQGDKLTKGIDIVHYPYFEPFFLTLPFFKKYKSIVTVHDLTPLVFPNNFPAGLKGSLKWQVQKKLLQGMDVIADSISSKKDVGRYAGVKDERIHVVYLAAAEHFRILSGEARSRSAREIRRKYDLPNRFILYVGDVTWNKNMPRIIDAARKARVPLVMVGQALAAENFDKKNPWNQDLVKVKKMVQENRDIFLLGFVPDEDLVSIYNTAEAFIMPSLYEGFGLPILEAMSCGCPVITSKEGSLPEIAGEAAYYVDAYDVDSIKIGIQKVLGNEKLRQQLRDKGLGQSKKFSWKKTAEETVKVYESIIK